MYPSFEDEYVAEGKYFKMLLAIRNAFRFRFLHVQFLVINNELDMERQEDRCMLSEERVL